MAEFKREKAVLKIEIDKLTQILKNKNDSVARVIDPKIRSVNDDLKMDDRQQEYIFDGYQDEIDETKKDIAELQYHVQSFRERIQILEEELGTDLR